MSDALSLPYHFVEASYAQRLVEKGEELRVMNSRLNYFRF